MHLGGNRLGSEVFDEVLLHALYGLAVLDHVLRLALLGGNLHYEYFV
jgi:hypothetical protein